MVSRRTLSRMWSTGRQQVFALQKHTHTPDEIVAGQIDELQSMVPRTGTAVLNFGSIPSMSASVYVPTQLALTETSKVTIWFQADEMGGPGEHNTAEDHLLAASSITITAGEPIPGDGFWIYAESDFALWTGKFRVRWLWTI